MFKLKFMKLSSKDTRERAVTAYKNGVSADEICKNFGICRKTLYLWRKREAEDGDLSPKPKGHRPRALSPEDMEQIRELRMKDSSLYVREIGEKLGLTCHLSILWRALKEMGFTYKKKPVRK